MQEQFVRPPRPRGVVLVLMSTIGCLWVLFAASINWTSAPFAQQLWDALVGKADAILHGQLWRLVTALLLHNPATPSHALIAMMLLFFFAAPLEAAWGTKRMVVFFLAAALIGNGLEAVAGVLPSLATPTFYGSMALANAATVAWAFENRYQVVRIFLIVPVRPLMMVGLLVLWHVALLIARQASAEGLVAPFGGMLAGWLLCDASPLRRFWLTKKLGHYQRELDLLRTPAQQRSRTRKGGPDLRVIRGGDDSGPKTLN